MPLPDNFSPTEHLQDQVKRLVNKSVARYFKDLGGENWDPPADLKAAPRASLRLACTHQELDTINQTVTRLFLYYMVVRRDELTESSFYGLPVAEVQATVRFRPQIVLTFVESFQTVTNNEQPVTGRISFRLQNETDTTITEAKLRAIAQLIKTRFGGSTPKRWQKGKSMATYVDKERGYGFQILCRLRSEARELITDVLALQEHTPEWERFVWHENEEPGTAYDESPGQQMVLGALRRKPRRRPNKDVFFESAACLIWGMPRAIVLYSVHGRGKPLIDP